MVVARVVVVLTTAGRDVVVGLGRVVLGALDVVGAPVVDVVDGDAVVVLLSATPAGGSDGMASPDPRSDTETCTAGLSPRPAQPAAPTATSRARTKFRFTLSRSGRSGADLSRPRHVRGDCRTLRTVASFGVRGSDAVVDVAVFRGLVDLMLDYPGLSAPAATLLNQERDVGTLTLDLVQHPLRDELEVALAWAAHAARTGGRSARSGDDVAPPDRLIEGGGAVAALFDRT